MPMIDLDASLPDLIIDHPGLQPLFEELGLEYSCGGKSLRTACRDRGLEPQSIALWCQQRLPQINDSRTFQSE